MRMRLDDSEDSDDPLVSLINLVDVFLILVAALLIALASRPELLDADTLTIVRNAGRPDMEIIIKDGQRIERYQGSGETGQGKGVKAGVAYRMQDGSLVYVPE